jgi:two-component system NarL family sensor kinase
MASVRDRLNGLSKRFWGGRNSVVGVTLQFGLVGFVVFALIAIGTTAELRKVSEREAIRDAKEVTRIAGNGIVAPALRQVTLEGNPVALAKLDKTVRAHVLREPVVRVKLWTTDGRIVYSDEPRLIGRKFDLGKSELNAVNKGIVDADVSDLDEPENVYDRQFGKLLEVYLPITGPNGQKLLYEDYLRYSAIASSQRRQLSALAPVLLAGLLILWLAQLPLAYSLARRLKQRQEEREALLQRAIDASAAQRRQIANELHGGVIQSIAGLAFGLTGSAARIAGTAARDEAPAIRAAAEEARHAAGELRGALLGIYEPAAERVGLLETLDDLAAPLRAEGTTVDLDLPDTIEIDRTDETLLVQVAREALRNISQHAGAAHVEVAVQSSEAATTIVVRDDGQGFSPGERAELADHFGLRLVADLVAARGGTFDLTSAPGEGTTVRAEVATK